MLPGPFKQKRPPGKTPFRRYDATTGRFTGVDAMAEVTMHLTPYQFGMNSPVMYNDPTGLLVSGAGYVARPGLQRGVDGYYKAPWEAEFEWNNEGFFDWYNHGVGGGNYSSINGITTKQVLSISPGEVQRYYEKQWAGTGRYVTKVRESPTRSGFDVGYADYSGRSNDVIVGTMFVSTAKMKDHLDGNGSGWDIVAALIGAGISTPLPKNWFGTVLPNTSEVTSLLSYTLGKWKKQINFFGKTRLYTHMTNGFPRYASTWGRYLGRWGTKIIGKTSSWYLIFQTIEADIKLMQKTIEEAPDQEKNTIMNAYSIPF